MWQEIYLVHLQRGIINITGFICTKALLPSRRCAFGEFESLAVALRRGWRMLQALLRRLRLRLKFRREPPAALPGTDVWRRAWGDGAHCPCATSHAAFNDKYSLIFSLNQVLSPGLCFFF